MTRITKKPGASYSSIDTIKKSTTSSANKTSNLSNASKSSGSSSLSRPSYSAPTPKPTSSSNVSKNDIPPSYTSNKNKKSSSNFGVIWIPTKRHNKKKDLVYNPHINDRHRERSPSMYHYMKQAEKERSGTDAPKLPKTSAVAGTVAAVDPLVADNGKEDETYPLDIEYKSDRDENRDSKNTTLSLRDNAEIPKDSKDTTISENDDDYCVMCLYCCLDSFDCCIM